MQLLPAPSRLARGPEMEVGRGRLFTVGSDDMRLIDELISVGFARDGAIQQDRSYFDGSEMPRRERLRCGDWFASVGEAWVNFYRRDDANRMIDVKKISRRDRDKIIKTARQLTGQ